VRFIILAALICARLTAELSVQLTNEAGCKVENDYFIADMTPRVVAGRQEDSGTLRALTIKFAGITLLRTQNRMHWAPSFQRAGAKGYTSIATWHPVQEVVRDVKPGRFTITRKGHHQDYPEIRLEATYEFLDGVPYFLFSSVMEIEKPLEIYWLRNQEMTMDAFFTHVAWPDEDGKPVLTAFENRQRFLDGQPLPPDLPWICFLNLDKGYGFGAVVLEYSATTTAGAKTQINDGQGNGKYWDRHLVSQANTRLTPGDRYTERTAYLVVKTSRVLPLADFLSWEGKIRVKHLGQDPPGSPRR
jgi:hypothetical protein